MQGPPACPQSWALRGGLGHKHPSVGWHVHAASLPAVPELLPAPARPALPKQKALVRGYTAPRLPRAAYAHGVHGRAHQAVMERERRRICLRWLDTANPAIPGQVALAVLDTERWVRVGALTVPPAAVASCAAAWSPKGVASRVCAAQQLLPATHTSCLRIACPPAGRRL